MQKGGLTFTNKVYLLIFMEFVIFQFEPLDENRVFDLKILSQLSPKIGNSNERFGKQNAKLYPIV